MRALILIAAVALLVGLPATASAQIIPRSVQIDLMGGYYWFPSNYQNYNNSGIVGGRLGVIASRWQAHLVGLSSGLRIGQRAKLRRS